MAMTLLDLMVKIGAQDDASGAIERMVSGAVAKGQLMADAVKAGVSAVASGVQQVVGGALDAYASFEQLEGGVSKLYGTGGKTLEEYAASMGQTVDQAKGKYAQLEQATADMMRNANAAYQTAGMSANQYMEQATSFSAALISSLNGDTVEAARVTDIAMRAMSDNVNTFGSNAQDVQNAFQGFAKQNYTMLDNLKLGYGGTKEEMQRLLDDANKVASAHKDWADEVGATSELSIDSYADIVKAIELVQREQGIAGTTAKEAASTIEGSLAMTKAAWENLLTSLGGGGEELGKAMDAFTDSLAIAAGNVVPRILEIAENAIGALPKVAGSVAESIGEHLLPKLDEVTGGAASRIATALGGAVEAFGSHFEGIGKHFDSIRGTVAATAAYIEETFSQGAFEGAASAFGGLVESVVGAFDSVVSACAPVATAISDAFNGGVVSSFLGMLSGLVDGLSRTFQPVGQAIGDVIGLLDGPLAAAMDAVGAAFEGTGEVVGDVFGAMADAVGPLLGRLSPLAEAMGRVFSGAVLAAVDGLQAFFGSVGPVIESVGSTISDALGPFVEELAPRIQEFVESDPFGPLSEAMGALGEAFGAVWEAVQPFVSFLMETLAAVALPLVTEAFALLGDGIRLVADLLTSVSTAISDAAQWVTEKWTALVEFFAGVPAAIGAFVDSTAQLFAELPTRIGEFLSAVVSNVGQWVSDMVARAVQMGTEFLGNVVAWFAQLPARIGEFVSNALSRVAQWVSDMGGKAQQAGSDFLGRIGSWFQQLPGKIWGFLSDAIGKAGQFVSDMGAKAAEAASAFFSAVTSGLSGLPGAVMSIGSDIVRGIWSGIQGAADWLWGKVTSFASGIANAAMSALGIGSPSKVMRDKVGKWIPAGIAVGVEGALPGLYRSISEGCERATKAARDGMAGVEKQLSASASYALNAPDTAVLEVARTVSVHADEGAKARAASVSVTGNTFVVREEADIDRIADELAVRIGRAMRE